MEESPFKLNEPLTNETLDLIGTKLGKALGVDRKPKLKGIRIYYVDKFGVLLTSGLFAKGFSPEDWDEDND